LVDELVDALPPNIDIRDDAPEPALEEDKEDTSVTEKRNSDTYWGAAKKVK
jgi:hypothetical protein